MVALPFQTDHHWTVTDLNELPEDGNRYELLQGELIVSPSPGRTHQRLLRWLTVRLDAATKEAKAGEAIVGPMDVQLSAIDLVEPDLFYIRDDQADQYKDRYFEGAPAFVIEVVSPSSGTYDRIRKSGLYMNSGVEEYWVIEPDKHRVLIHTANASTSTPRVVTSGGLTSVVLPAFKVDVDDLFAAADRPRS